MQSTNDLRRRWLELQLIAEYDEPSIAAVGSRVQTAIGEQHAVDAYEVALSVTLDVLRARRDHPSPGLDGRPPRSGAGVGITSRFEQALVMMELAA
jgi:hypothetical protein